MLTVVYSCRETSDEKATFLRLHLLLRRHHHRASYIDRRPAVIGSCCYQRPSVSVAGQCSVPPATITNEYARGPKRQQLPQSRSYELIYNVTFTRVNCPRPPPTGPRSGAWTSSTLFTRKFESAETETDCRGIMDMENVKQIFRDAGTALSRAVQVRRRTRIRLVHRVVHLYWLNVST